MNKKKRTINNKLTVAQVRAIKALEGKESGLKLAAKYKVHFNTIYKIWNGHNWKWLNEETKGND